MHQELLNHKDQIKNHDKYAENKAKLINDEMDVVIRSETSPL